MVFGTLMAGRRPALPMELRPADIFAFEEGRHPTSRLASQLPIFSYTEARKGTSVAAWVLSCRGTLHVGGMERVLT